MLYETCWYSFSLWWPKVRYNKHLPSQRNGFLSVLRLVLLNFSAKTSRFEVWGDYLLKPKERKMELQVPMTNSGRLSVFINFGFLFLSFATRVAKQFLPFALLFFKITVHPVLLLLSLLNENCGNVFCPDDRDHSHPSNLKSNYQQFPKFIVFLVTYFILGCLDSLRLIFVSLWSKSLRDR